MKAFPLFILIFESFLRISSARSLLPFALSQVITKHFVHRHNGLDFLIVGKNTSHLIKLVEETVTRTPLNFPYRLVVVNDINANYELKFELQRSIIVLFEKFESSKRFFAQHRRSFKINRQCLIFIWNDKLKRDYAREYALFAVETSSQFCFLKEENDGSVRLITWQLFHQPDCRAWKEIEVNWITKKSKAWTKDEFFPQRFKNFNRCELIARTVAQFSPYVMFLTKYKSATGYESRGLAIRIHETIEKSLNFTTFYDLLDYRPSYSKNPKKAIDFNINAYPLRALSHASASSYFTHPFYTQIDLFLIPPGELYTSFEKMLLPFDFDVWIWMIVTFSTGILTIAIVKRTPKQIQNFIFGSRVQTPMMNMLWVSIRALDSLEFNY